MDKEPKNYEIGFLAVDEADEKEVVNLLKGYKAEILHEGRAKKVKLAYPIKKQTAAHFGFVQFSLDPDLVKPLREQLKLNAKILRSLIFVIPAKQLAKAEEFKGERPEKPPKERIRQMVEEPPRKKPEIVDNELLEKKLEEILK